MPLLSIPLALDEHTRTLKLTTPDIDWLGERLRFYVFSGVINANFRPFPKIQEMWEWLFLMGTGSRFRSILLDAQRRDMENGIKEELDTWLSGNNTIINIALLGDEVGREPRGVTENEQDSAKLIEMNSRNALWIRTPKRGYFFIFERVTKGGGMIGPWNIKEDTYDIR